MQKRFANGGYWDLKKITRLDGHPAGEIAIRSPFHDYLPTFESREVNRGKLSQRMEFFQGLTEHGGRRQRKEGYNAA